MKRYGKLFDQAFSVDNLLGAYEDARRGKRNRRACFEFERHLGARIMCLHKALMAGKYRPQPYHEFTVHEPKERVIHAPAFTDVVVQHAIYRVIYPLFDRTFIDQSFACRKGYGTHRASNYTQEAMRRCDGDDYFLQLDIRKFFYSIDRAVLRRLVERKIKDKRLVDVMMLFADYTAPRGIPIGNLLSQIYALIYLNPLDHFIKRELKVRHYVRYVDDFVLLGLTRQQCLDYRRLIITFLRDELGLELSKTTIATIRKGINFVGYRTWRSCRVIRKYSLFKFRRRVRSGELPAVVSLLGHAKKTQSLRYMLNLLREVNHALFLQIPAGIRRLHHLSTTAPGACGGSAWSDRPG